MSLDLVHLNSDFFRIEKISVVCFTIRYLVQTIWTELQTDDRRSIICECPFMELTQNIVISLLLSGKNYLFQGQWFYWPTKLVQ